MDRLDNGVSPLPFYELPSIIQFCRQSHTENSLFLTVSKLLQIIGQICAFDRGSSSFQYILSGVNP